MAPPGSLKEQGNAAFAAAKYQDAAELYTTALAAEDLEQDDLAALYSNRCAAFIHLFRFDLGKPAVCPLLRFAGPDRMGPALLDADQAVKLRQTWSRGYARRGEAFSHLCEFDAAEQQCASHVPPLCSSS